MKRMNVVMMAALALSMSGLAVAQNEPAMPKAKAAPKAKTPYAMAWTSSSSSSGSYLGVDISEVTSDRVAPLKLKEERGVEITMVDRDAPAGKAGLKEHDVVLELNGTRIEGEEQLRRMLRETPAGRKVTLGISRDGQPMKVEATLAARETAMKGSMPRVFRLETPDVAVPMPDIQIPQFEVMVRSYSRRTGMMVDNLTPQLGEFFGAKSGQGVLVRSVEKGSAAEAAGLKAGDVIVKVDSEDVDDRNDWNRIMRKKGGKISIGIIRDKRDQTLTVTLPELNSSEEGRFLQFDDDSSENFQPQVEAEKIERALHKFQHEFEINAPRIAGQQVRLKKAMVESQARIESQLAKAHELMQKNRERQSELLQHQHEQLKKELERAAHVSERI